MKCQKCELENLDNAKFCSNCGTNLIDTKNDSANINANITANVNIKNETTELILRGMRVKFRAEYYTKPLIERMPVKILLFGKKRYFGIELDDLINNTDCVYYNIIQYDLKNHMHRNITLNTDIMSQEDYYQINLYLAIQLFNVLNTQKDEEVLDYLLDYFEQELEYIEANPNQEPHSDAESIERVKNSYKFKNLAERFPIFAKQYRAPSGMKYNVFIIEAKNFFMYLYNVRNPKDSKVTQAIKDLSNNYMKDIAYFVDGIFSKDYYLDINVAKSIAEEYLFKDGIKKEIKPLLLNYKDKFDDRKIIEIHHLIEYLQLQKREFFATW